MTRARSSSLASTSRAKAGTRAPRLAASISLLRDHYGRMALLSPTDPFELLLWEYAAYLTDDADRAAAFALLRKRVGTAPKEIAAAPPEVLDAVCRAGGAIAFRVRAQRMHDVAVRVLERFDSDLAPVLKRPYLEARKVLKTFPAIGPPGADKILLLTGARAILALDSNALRVLLRLGYGVEHRSYGASYASAQKAATAELESSIKSMREASALLRRHGQVVCRRIDPHCPVCPLRETCAFARVR